MAYRVKILDSDSCSAPVMEQAIKSLGTLRLEDCRRITVIPSLDSPHRSEQSGAIARVELVEQVIRFIERHSESRITIACGLPCAEAAFRNLGYEDLASKHKAVTLLDLNSCERVKALPPDPKILGPTLFSEELILSDAFIYVAPLRRHVHERIAASWLTPFSLVTDKNLKLKAQSHMSKALFDLNMLTWPDLCVVDAQYALEGTGPIWGRPKYIGKIVIGLHPLATDVAAAKIVGESPKRIPHLKYALKQFGIKEKDVVLEGTYSPIQLDSISGNQYRLWRIGLWLRRISTKIENLGTLIMYLSLALTSVGAKDLATGRWVSIKNSLKFASDVYSKIYDAETLLDKKIVINRHVKEQSIS